MPSKKKTRKPRVEFTSARVAQIAGRLLNIEGLKKDSVDHWDGFQHTQVCTLAELKAVAASALNQTKDKPKK